MICLLAALTIGDGIAICGGLASVLAIVFIVAKRKPAGADELMRAAQSLDATAKALLQAAQGINDKMDCGKQLSDSAKMIAEQVANLHNKFEDVVRLDVDMANTKSSLAGLKVRFDKLYDIVHAMLRASGGN